MLETAAWDLIVHYLYNSLSVYPHFCVSDHRDKKRSQVSWIRNSRELWASSVGGGSTELQSCLYKSSMFTSLRIQLFSPIADYG